MKDLNKALEPAPEGVLDLFARELEPEENEHDQACIAYRVYVHAYIVDPNGVALDSPGIMELEFEQDSQEPDYAVPTVGFEITETDTYEKEMKVIEKALEIRNKLLEKINQIDSLE